MCEEDGPTGLDASRTYLQSARMAGNRYIASYDKATPDRTELMLYYSAFFVLAKASVEAIGKSDARSHAKLADIQAQYFQTVIRSDPVFALLIDERNRVSHGDDSWAAHPHYPMSMLERFEDAGYDWHEVVFNNFWPEAPFKGAQISDVMSAVCAKILEWQETIQAIVEEEFYSREKSVEPPDFSNKTEET